MIKNKFLLILNLLITTAFAKYSLLAPSVPTPLQELNLLVNERSTEIEAKLKSMKEGVIQNIQEQIEKKKKNTEILKKLSKLDYVTNSEYLFLLKKVNELTNNAINSQNTTTSPKNPKPTIKKGQKR